MAPDVFYDKEQMLFSKDGTMKPNDFKFAVIQPKPLDYSKMVTCPFCLFWSRVSKYLISTKKGYDLGAAHCPKCNQTMKLKTLLAMHKWTPEQYAQFIVDYPPKDFFNKIKAGCGFEVWFNRMKYLTCIVNLNGQLKKVPWSGPFWKEYRRFKPKVVDAENEVSNAYDRRFEEKIKLNLKPVVFHGNDGPKDYFQRPECGFGHCQFIGGPYCWGQCSFNIWKRKPEW